MPRDSGGLGFARLSQNGSIGKDDEIVFCAKTLKMLERATHPCEVSGTGLHEPATLHDVPAFQPPLQEGVPLHLDVLCQNVLQARQLRDGHGAPGFPRLAVRPSYDAARTGVQSPRGPGNGPLWAPLSQ